MTASVLYGRERIFFTVDYVARKTMEIAVHPDQRVIVKAPEETDIEAVLERVRKRVKWIRKQIHFFRQFEPRTPQRRYVSGETHLYLGRQYWLKVRKGASDVVKMRPGFFDVTVEAGRTSSVKVCQLLEQWYADKARQRFEESFCQCWARLSWYPVSQPKLRIRRMKTRWGSLSRKGTLTLNVDLIRAPRPCVEYVILHELAHLKYHDHSSRFYHFLEELLPDWKKRKERLERSLV